jgi:hypothetical protein
MDELLRGGEAANCAQRVDLDPMPMATLSDTQTVGRRQIVRRDASENAVAFIETKYAELGLADTHRIAQYGLENRLHLAG